MTDETKTQRDAAAVERGRRASRRPTLKTISEMTGLSMSAVSQSLRGYASLKPETRQLIAEAARQIGYVPDRAGVRLRTGKTSVVALVLSNSASSVDFTRQIIAGVGQSVARTNYHLTVIPEVDDGAGLGVVHHILDSGSADGVILTHTAPRDARVQLLMQAGFPFVTHGRTEFSAEHAFHDFHSETFAELAVERLVSLGCRHLMLAQSATNTMNYRNILTAFRGACVRAAVAGDAADEDLVSLGGYDEVRHFGRRQAQRADRPDGIVCNSELYALALCSGLQDGGAVVGRDIKLVCKETSGILPIVFPQTDGIVEDVCAAGRELMRLLLARIAGNRPLSALQTLGAPIPRWRHTSPDNESQQSDI